MFWKGGGPAWRSEGHHHYDPLVKGVTLSKVFAIVFLAIPSSSFVDFMLPIECNIRSGYEEGTDQALEALLALELRYLMREMVFRYRIRMLEWGWSIVLCHIH